MSRRRQSIHENFLEYFRYRNPPRIRPGTTPSVSTNNEVGRDAARRAATGMTESALRAEVGARFVQDQPQIRLIVRDARGHLWSLSLQTDAFEGGASVMPEDFPMDPKLLAMLLGEEAPEASHSAARAWSSQATAQAREAAAQASGQNSPLWVRIPPGQAGQELLHAIARLVSPSGNLSQDGLKALLNSPQFQALFQGAQLAQGASQMFSLHMLVGILIPPSMFLGNPEMAKALLIAQGLPPGLIQSIPDRAIAGALQALLQTSQTAGQNPLHFLQAVASALTLAGTPVQEVQNLLMQMLEAAKRQGLAMPGDMEVTPEMLKALAAKLMAGNNPQLLGLNQMVQESFGQGLAQIFNAFIRVFLGGALMQGQQMWPQAVPNERMLAELGGLFGALGSKENRKKEEKRRSRKQVRKELRIDDPAYSRVERKDDMVDEPQQEGGDWLEAPEGEESETEAVAASGEMTVSDMESIFIKVDES